MATGNYRELKKIWGPMVQWAYECAKGAGITNPRDDDVRAFLIQALKVNKPWKAGRDEKIKRPAKKWDEYWADFLLEKEWDNIDKNVAKGVKL